MPNPVLKIHHELFDVTREEKIIFWDHCSYAKGPLRCTVRGLNVLETDLYIVMAWWDTECEDNEREDNCEFVTILKSAIISRYIPEWKKI